MKNELYKLVTERKRISIGKIHKHLGIDPTCEEDRKKVWQVGQGLAELARERHITLDVSTGTRVFYAV